MPGPGQDDTLLNPGAGGDVIATEVIPGGKKVQDVKAAFGPHGTMTLVEEAAPLPTHLPRGQNVSRTRFNAQADAQVLGQNARVRAVFYNDAAVNFLLGEGSGVVTASDFTVLIPPGGFYTVDDTPLAVHGMFVGDPLTKALMVTEVT